MSDQERDYVVRYRCALDPGCPVFVTRVRGYDREDARERFLEDDDLDGPWQVLGIELAKDQTT